MKMTARAIGVLLLTGGWAAAGAAGGAEATAWHGSLCLPGGGWWRQRVGVDVRNAAATAARGEAVTVRVAPGEGLAALVGAAAEAVRVCDANGVEMLYALDAPDGQAVRAGAIAAGTTLSFPVECAAKASARYYVYFDNPAAWRVPDYLPSVGSLHNGGVEDGEGDTPAAWRHDEGDAQHHASWTTENPHGGKRCLKTVVAAGAEPAWIATRQKGIRIRGGGQYVMRAWVRAQDVVGQAGWYIHVGNAAKFMMLAPTLSGGEGTYDWKQVSTTFTAPAEADQADLGTVLRGTGTAWFDDVTLECLTPSALTAAAGQAERLELRDVGADAPWRAQGHRPFRIPVRVMNATDRPMDRPLVAVTLGGLVAHAVGAFDPMTLVVRDGERTLPNYFLGDSVLFEATVPARTARTFHVYQRLADKLAAAEPMAYAELLASPRNLVKNGSFEADGPAPAAPADAAGGGPATAPGPVPADWVGSAEGARPAGSTMGLDSPGLLGKRCVKTHVPDGAKRAWVGWRQDVPVRPGGQYLLAAWLKCRDIRDGDVRVHVHYLNAAGKLCASKKFASTGEGLTGSADWTLVSETFTMPEDAATFQVHLTMNATGTVWHDGVVLVEVTPGTVRPPETPSAPQSPGTALPGVPPSSSSPPAPPTVSAWAVNAVVKVFREDLPPSPPPAPASAPAGAVRISAARNESEPLQVAFRSPAPLAGATVEVDLPTAAVGGAKLTDVTVGVVGYVPIDHPTNYYRDDGPAWRRKVPAGPGSCDGWAGFWPDPILPRKTLDLAAQATQPVWITVRVPKDAAAGDYAGTVRLVHGGKAVAAVPFVVHVWNFALPDGASLPAIYDVRAAGPMWRQAGDGPQDAQRRMWRFMAERRLCPDRIQPDPVFRYDAASDTVSVDFTAYDQAAEYYFNVLKLPHSYTPQCFYLFGWAHPPDDRFGQRPYDGESPYANADRSKLRPQYKRAYQACLKAYWDHVKAKGWAGKIVLYISDEPHDDHPFVRQQMVALCRMIHEVDAAIPIYSSTWHHQPEWDGSLDVWGIGHYGVVPTAKMADLRSAGKRLWYTTDGHMCTDTPYCGVERLLPHYCFHYGVQAYEFWGIDWLTYNPYEYGWHSYNRQADSPGEYYYIRYPNGDGFLAYPGGPIGQPGPVPSVRTEQAREGVEDYEYLLVLRQRLAAAKAAGKPTAAGEAALRDAARLVTIPNAGGRYSTKVLPNPDAVFAVKEAVARAIEATVVDKDAQ